MGPSPALRGRSVHHFHPFSSGKTPRFRSDANPQRKGKCSIGLFVVAYHIIPYRSNDPVFFYFHASRRTYIKLKIEDVSVGPVTLPELQTPPQRPPTDDHIEGGGNHKQGSHRTNFKPSFKYFVRDKDAWCTHARARTSITTVHGIEVRR
jgi:hypothetical protein